MNSLLKSAVAWALTAVGLLAFATAAQAQVPTNLVGSYKADLVFSNTVYGRVDVSITSAGKATGKAIMPNGKTYSFSVTLAADGGGWVKADHVVVKGRFPIGPQPLTLTSIRLYPNGDLGGGFSSTIDGIPFILTFFNSAKLASYTGKGDSISPATGTYTMAMTADDDSAAGTPAGAGYATLTVTPNGKLTFKGKLIDGTPVTGNTLPASDGTYSLFRTVYTAGGIFTADINPLTRGAQPAQGYVKRPANPKAKLYRDGFAADLDVQVQPWAKLGAVKLPGAGLGFSPSKNFAVDFSGDGLGEADFNKSLPDTARFTSLGAVQAVSGGPGAPADNNSKEWNKVWAVKVNPATGEFTGSQRIKVGTRFVKLPVSGVLLLGTSVGNADTPFALGQYVVTPAGATPITGRVSFSGPLEDNPSVATFGNYSVKLRRIAFNPSSPTPLPSHAPADGATVKFSISEDLQTMVFNGARLPLTGDSRPVSLVYSNVQSSPSKSVSVIVYLNYAGQIQGIAPTYLQTIIDIKKNPPAQVRTGYFQNFTDGPAGFTKL